MNIAILGYGSQGASALEYWNKPENSITVCDRNEALELPDDIAAQLGAGYLAGLDRFDLILRTPSIHPSDIVAANSEAILDKVTTNTNEFMRVCPTKNIIGVTGTKGKGTTSTLIARMLEAAGYKVHLGGNIGIPPLEMLKENIQPNDYVVLELANFQLIDIKYSPHIAVCVMIQSEHQDWHHSVEEYYESKKQLFRWQTADDIAIYYGADDESRNIASGGLGKKMPYYIQPGAHIEDSDIVIDNQIVCNTSAIRLLGKHNWQNVCAAVTAVWNITHDVEAIHRAVSSFSGLPFRLERIREVDGVIYYNDSFGTTPDTAIVAIQAFTQPKVIVLGGSDKGTPFDRLVDIVLQNNVRAVITIGDTGPVIAKQLRDKNFDAITEGLTTMSEIVAKMHTLAQPGDIALLSTGCASFGLFKNYKDRGEQFNQAVLALSSIA